MIQPSTSQGRRGDSSELGLGEQVDGLDGESTDPADLGQVDQDSFPRHRNEALDRPYRALTPHHFV